ncbi:hypothetical protein K458DRAFT_385855 [Lentithecium fluviatile CBS 122367]|uniref:BTB domain-containing protein n=1 Tax=Lentithecium fluviatile CBS 122367 TaxID=1168545 RepID=A0A6G1J930_9PLEO|nr:hypothetical protein K458DRAFT_385855 [Lentithecium fluviatile CBS 122367]
MTIDTHAANAFPAFPYPPMSLKIGITTFPFSINFAASGGKTATRKLPKVLLSRQSEYFRAVCNPTFEEGVGKQDALTDCDSQTFKVFVWWLRPRLVLKASTTHTGKNKIQAILPSRDRSSAAECSPPGFKYCVLQDLRRVYGSGSYDMCLILPARLRIHLTAMPSSKPHSLIPRVFLGPRCLTNYTGDDEDRFNRLIYEQQSSISRYLVWLGTSGRC